LKGAIRDQCTGEEVAHLRRLGAQQPGEGRSVVAGAVQGRFELVESPRQNRLHDFGRHSLFAKPERVLEGEGQRPLYLHGGSEPVREKGR